MAYINRKMKLFNRGDHILLEPRRSEARLKTYPSAVDVRAWCDIVEDRRQHILELMNKGKAKCSGSLIPIEAILRAFGGGGRVNLDNCAEELANLYKFINGLELSDEDKKKLQKLKNGFKEKREGKTKMGKVQIGDKLDYEPGTSGLAQKTQGGLTDAIPGSRKNGKDGKDEKENICEERKCKKTTIKQIISKAQLKKANVCLENAHPGCYVTKSQGPARIISRVQLNKPKSAPLLTTQESAKIKSENIASQLPISPKKEVEASDTVVKDIFAASPTSHSDTAVKDILAASPASPQIVAKAPTRNSKDESSSSSLPTIVKFADTATPAKSDPTLDYSQAISNLTKERDDLQEQLKNAKLQLEHYKNLAEETGTIPQSCQDEVEALEREIQLMRNGSASPEQEAEVIHKEINLLKKYCSRVAGIEQENQKLKKEKDDFMQHYEKCECGVDDSVVNSQINELKEKLKGVDQLTKERDDLSEQVQKLGEELKQYQNTPANVEGVQAKCQILDNVLEERDNLLKRLEQVQDMESEFEELKKKAKMVDELERELEVYTRNGKTADMEVRRSKSRCCNMERELQNTRCERDAMSKRICCMKKENESLKCRLKETEFLKLERDRLQIKLNELSQIQVDYEEMLPQLAILENIKCERDMYKSKYDEMVSLECECQALHEEVKQAKNIGIERNNMVDKIENLESCICDQEEEIKSLVNQIEKMSQNRDLNQDRIKDALANMRDEIDQKDMLIAESEEKLAAVQTQLSDSIQCVTCETAYLKNEMDNLQRELRQAQANVAEKNTQIKYLQENLKGKEMCLCNLDRERKMSKQIANKSEAETIEYMKRELETARLENKKLQEIAGKMMSLTGDEHVQRMLKQSECAVKRVVEELGRQYQQWEKVKFSGTNNKRCKRKCSEKTNKDLRVISENEGNEKLRQELEETQTEKDRLQNLIKQIQEDSFSKEEPEKELIALRIDNAKLQSQLQKEIQNRRTLELKLNIS